MSDDPRVGSTLAGRYRLDGLLGAGGMGKVYAAEHVLMRKKLAVKVLHRELTTVPEVVKRFEREAMAAAHIEHPNVAAATDFGKLDDGSVFLVLEFVEGESLRDEIAKGPLAVERSLRITRQIASALESAHHLEIVHRDLKPENVMLVQKAGQSDFVKVLDFGIAKVPIGEMPGRSGPPITRAGMVFGTPEYMAPEQALGQTVDGRADLYALGTIVYEMLAGVRPFSSKSQVGILGQQLSNPVPSFADRAPGIGVPPAVEKLVQRLLAKEPDERFQKAGEVVASVDELLRMTSPQDARLFTQLGGSPREMLGSYPGVPPSADASSLPLPAFPYPDSSIDLTAAVTGVGEPALPAAGPPAIASGLDPIGPSSPLERARRVKSEQTGGPLGRLTGVPGVSAAVRFIDAKRGSLPVAMRRVIDPVPSLVLLLGATLALLGLFGVLIVMASGADVTSDPGASSSSQARASASAAAKLALPSASAPAMVVEPSIDSELEQARKQGVEALALLAKKHPENGPVWLALAEAQVQAKSYKAAVVSVSKSLEVDPVLNESKKVASLLFRTAQSKSAGEQTFELLEGPMGRRGADIVYDIAIHKGIKPAVKTRAEAYLSSQAFEKASSPALNVAVALRHAKRCEQTYALLLRAKNVGDARSLPYLEPLQKTHGCGSGGKKDCYPCMRNDDRLNQVVQALRSKSAN